MTNTDRPNSISRRDTVALFAATAALGAGAMPSGAFGGTTVTDDLSQLSADHFEALVGDTFTIGGMTVTLRDVRRSHETRFRQQFAVTFDAPQSMSIGTEPTRVSHPAIGQHDIFIAEVNDSDHRLLEICFS
jgi:hypothetical protein